MSNNQYLTQKLNQLSTPLLATQRRTRTLVRTRRTLHENTVNPDVTFFGSTGGGLSAATTVIAFATQGASPTLIPSNYALVDWGQAQNQTPYIYSSAGGNSWIYHKEPWSFQQGKTIRFYTDATSLSVMGYYGVNGLSKVWVDGQPAAANNLIAWQYTNLYLNMTFAFAKPRLIEIKTDNWLCALYINPNAQVWAPEPLQGPRVLCVGDSLTQGFSAAGNYGAYQMLDEFTGIPNIAIDGQGGSGYNPHGGYYSNGSDGSDAYLGPVRLANGIGWKPDVLVMGTSLNDFGAGRTVAQVEADMVTLFSAYRAALPNATLISSRCVITPYFRAVLSGTIPAKVDQLDADLEGGLLNNLGVKLLPRASGFFTGTGNIGTPVGDGNSDQYVGTDGVHPSDAGSLYFARRLSESLLGILEAP